MKPKSSIHSLTLTLPARRGGFSLIELMVAMTIGLLLLAGLFYIYINASQSSRVQGALALMQGNARYAFEIMGVDIRMIGFTGSQDANPSNVVNISQASTICPLIDIFGNKNCNGGVGPLFGYEADDPDTAKRRPPNVCTTANTTPCYRVGTDSLTVVRVDTENKYAISGHTPGTSFTLPTWPAGNAPEAGEIFVAADYTHAAVFQVRTIDTGAKTVSYGGTGTVSPGNSGTDLGSFSGGINALGLYRLSGVSYYIGRNPVGEPALYRDKLGHSGTTANSTAEELVQGVEDMQITYGVDTSIDDPTGNRLPLPGDGIVNGYWTAAEVNANTPNIQSAICNASASARWKCVLSVRITLTLVSGQDESVGTTGDRLLRKTFTNTIAIRNRLP
jgi:type IV pilus assembly protein PilW